MIRRGPLGLCVIITVHQLTTVGRCRYTLRINPAYRYAYSNARKTWREGASFDRYKNCRRARRTRMPRGFGKALPPTLSDVSFHCNSTSILLVVLLIPGIQHKHKRHPVTLQTDRTTRSSASAKYRIFLLFSPAIEIRPFAVKYTCASSISALDCAVEIPVKL